MADPHSQLLIGWGRLRAPALASTWSGRLLGGRHRCLGDGLQPALVQWLVCAPAPITFLVVNALGGQAPLWGLAAGVVGFAGGC